MNHWVFLLRGINVGKTKRMAMADLREAMEGAGFTAVATHLQSGNVVAAGPDDRVEASAALSAVIEKRFGFEVPVVARTADEMAAALADNPFPEAEAEAKSLHLVYCQPEPASDGVDNLDAERFAPDRFALVGGVLYIDNVVPVHRSKLTIPVIEKALGVTATARNWNTATKLAAMAAEAIRSAS